jgi:hypothetical protein
LGGAARDAGQLWDANPLESLALGSGHEGRALLLRLRYVAQSCDDERSLGRPVPGVRLIRGLNRTKKITTSRAVPPLFFTPVRRRASGAKG